MMTFDAPACKIAAAMSKPKPREPNHTFSVLGPLQTVARNSLPPVTRATFPSRRKRESKPWIAAIVFNNAHKPKKDINSVCLRSFHTFRIIYLLYRNALAQELRASLCE